MPQLLVGHQQYGHRKMEVVLPELFQLRELQRMILYDNNICHHQKISTSVSKDEATHLQGIRYICHGMFLLIGFEVTNVLIKLPL